MSMTHLFVSMYLLLSMIAAAKRGDLAEVRRMLASGEDVNQTDGVSVLSVATFIYAPHSASVLIVSVDVSK